jgi:hypothetical protein
MFNAIDRARFGIKLNKICQSSSGYCLSFKIYTGDDVQYKCSIKHV